MLSTSKQLYLALAVGALFLIYIAPYLREDIPNSDTNNIQDASEIPAKKVPNTEPIKMKKPVKDILFDKVKDQFSSSMSAQKDQLKSALDDYTLDPSEYADDSSTVPQEEVIQKQAEAPIEEEPKGIWEGAKAAVSEKFSDIVDKTVEKVNERWNHNKEALKNSIKEGLDMAIDSVNPFSETPEPTTPEVDELEKMKKDISKSFEETGSKIEEALEIARQKLKDTASGESSEAPIEPKPKVDKRLQDEILQAKRKAEPVKGKPDEKQSNANIKSKVNRNKEKYQIVDERSIL